MKQQVNLLKSLSRPTRNWFKDDVVLAIGGIFLVFLMLTTLVQWTSGLWAKHKFNILQKEYVDINARFVKEQRGLFELTQIQQELADKTKLLELLHVSISRSPTCPDVTNYFQSLSQARVAGLWLTNFQLQVDTRYMTLTGNTQDPILIVNWLKALGKTPCFGDMKFYSIDVQKNQDAANKNSMSFTVMSDNPKVRGATK